MSAKVQTNEKWALRAKKGVQESPHALSDLIVAQHQAIMQSAGTCLKVC